ncbi:MAG: signal recognition particle subunit SRP19/SEC65 family protein [Archaeoglobaceae archaeon]|nr:signal recognition particle protein Srp19 [Archaeoglobaceae archaeon]MDW7989653.1 signal recognition particle subunit SRP19/SEC65 family protein [Archaeoglobaceae archaeon]
MRVWTANLDAKKTRAMGRKIPKRFAVPNVRFQELIQACKELGLDFSAEDKKYPRCWWEEGGMVVIRSNNKKLMIDIARKITEIRERKKKK